MDYVKNASCDRYSSGSVFIFIFYSFVNLPLRTENPARFQVKVKLFVEVRR